MKNLKKLACVLLLTSVGSSAFAMNYSTYLKRYPLPKLNKTECAKSDMRYWLALEERLISTEKLKKKSKTALNKKLEDHIQKNALITLAYSRIAKKKNHKELYPIWMFAGANASHIVGSSLKLNYKYINNLPLKPSEKLDFMQALVFKQRKLGNQVAKGNQGVYLNIFWKYLSADICGAATTIRLLSEDRIKHHKEIIVWRNFLYSRKSFLNKSQKLAIDYVNIEQRLLQDIMYDSLSSRFGNGLRLFNSFANLELTMPNAPSFLSFNDYSAKYIDLSNNLSNYKHRVSWMKYLIRSMTPFIDEVYKSGASHKSFINLEKLNLKMID